MSIATAGPEGIIHEGQVTQPHDLFEDAPVLGPLEYGAPTLIPLPGTAGSNYAVWRFEGPAGRYGVDLRLSEYRQESQRSEDFVTITQIVRKNGTGSFFSDYTYGGRDVGYKYFDHYPDDEVYLITQFLDRNYVPALGYAVPRITENGASDWIQAPDRDCIVAVGGSYQMKWTPEEDVDVVHGECVLNNEAYRGEFTYYQAFRSPSPHTEANAYVGGWYAASRGQTGDRWYSKTGLGGEDPWSGPPTNKPDITERTDTGYGGNYVGFSTGWDNGSFMLAGRINFTTSGAIFGFDHISLLRHCGKLGKGVFPLDGSSGTDVSPFLPEGVSARTIVWESDFCELLDLHMHPDEMPTGTDQLGQPTYSDDDGLMTARWVQTFYANGVDGNRSTPDFGPWLDGYEGKFSEKGLLPAEWLTGKASIGELKTLALENSTTAPEWVPVDWQKAMAWEEVRNWPGRAQYVGVGGYLFLAMPEATLYGAIPPRSLDQPDPMTTPAGGIGAGRQAGMALKAHVRPVRFKYTYDAVPPDATPVFPGISGDLGPQRRAFLPRR